MDSSLSDAHVSLQLYPGYSPADTQIFRDFANHGAQPEPGFVVDFLGTRIRTTSLWTQARALDGQVLGIPDPADFHAEAIEWIGLLKAVASAERQYIAMELGAGFGAWSVAGAVAAKSRGITNIRLCAIEADPSHFQFLRQHFKDNGLEPDQHRLFEVAVGRRDGVAHWPVCPNPTEDWGNRPMNGSVDYTGRVFEQVRNVRVVSMLALVQQEPAWDLIHVDIQGDEVDVCSSCIDELDRRAKWLVIGTHSRKIDGELLELFCRAGWLLEHEKPAKFIFAPNAPTLESMTTLDGTQVWRNPHLTGK